MESTQHSLLKMVVPESAVSPLEKILKNPGLVHLAENIFDNLSHEDMEVCREINQSSKEIFDNPMFWLRKFGSLSKENQKDWINVIQSVEFFTSRINLESTSSVKMFARQRMGILKLSKF